MFYGIASNCIVTVNIYNFFNVIPVSANQKACNPIIKH